MIQVIHGDAINVLPTLQPASFDAVLTDPPYASGGLQSAQRNHSSGDKYLTPTAQAAPNQPDFEGETMDQRVWSRWCVEWLRECRRVVRLGGVLLCFIDWRQYAALSDALMEAGWLWRGVVVWDKGNARPQPGRFKAQTEFVLWASRGDFKPLSDPPVYLPGLLSHSNPSATNRMHQTQKPIKLLCDLLKIVPTGSRILDPFCGSGSTLESAAICGMEAVGIEISPEYAQIARNRVACFTDPATP